MTLDLFDDVFGLYFALEAAQGILERFTFLNSNLCQGKYTSQSGPEWLFLNDTSFFVVLPNIKLTKAKVIGRITKGLLLTTVSDR